MDLGNYNSVERNLAGLAAAAAIALALLVLIGLALTGTATGLDPRILLWVRSMTGNDGPVIALARGITAFGNDVTLWTVTLLAAGYLLVVRNRRAALQVAAMAATGGLLTAAIKLLVDRPRPAIVQHLADVHPPSFPSGHAMNSAFVYGTLALIAVRASGNTRGRRYVALVAVLMILLIGTSRVVLGVHWPSDVLAGWTIGATWAFLSGRLATLATSAALIKASAAKQHSGMADKR